MKKAIVTALAVVGMALGSATTALADDVPDVTDKSIKSARDGISKVGDIMTITLVNPINGCDRSDRRAVEQYEVYLRATDRSVVNVKFECP